jgi:molecular chaperone DnaJ
MRTTSLYDVLGVSRRASPDEIKSAYRTLARQYHPDKNPGDADAAMRFAEVRDAYTVLFDPKLRSRYDRGGKVLFGAGAARDAAMLRITRVAIDPLRHHDDQVA